jgi:hypothetical protein
VTSVCLRARDLSLSFRSTLRFKQCSDGITTYLETTTHSIFSRLLTASRTTSAGAGDSLTNVKKWSPDKPLPAQCRAPVGFDDGLGGLGGGAFAPLAGAFAPAKSLRIVSFPTQ